MNKAFVDECKQIHQNALYSAEAHHRMALRQKRASFWFQVVPGAIAAISGSLVAAGSSPHALLWLTVVSSVMAAVANILNPQKAYQDHLAAAKGFTAVKHDARFLHEAQSTAFTDEEFQMATTNLHDKYNELVKIVPPTDPHVFEEARKAIASGVHDPDKDERGKIK